MLTITKIETTAKGETRIYVDNGGQQAIVGPFDGESAALLLQHLLDATDTRIRVRGTGLPTVVTTGLTGVYTTTTR